MNRPAVGIGVLVRKNSKYIFGRRIGKHGKNTWSVPGGYLEYGEEFDACAAREVMEETGVKIKNIRQIATVNNVFHDETSHSITVFMAAEWASGEPKTMEPDKFIEIGWFDLKNLPSPLFLPVQQLQKEKPELFKA